MNESILLSILTRMNEERSYKRHTFQIFVSRWRRISFYHYKREWMKNEGERFYPFRFEMKATILLSFLTRMNEESSYKQHWFNCFRLEMNTTILLSLLTWMNDEQIDKISECSVWDESYNRTITANANEWRTKLQTILVSSFSFQD
jgi:hypothetical protein